ncbi:MAG: ABC transporter permease [Planctomycetota bacterium]|jgi:putative ABC transport system permease protein
MNFRFLPLVWKQVSRQRTRSILTALGVATAMFLFSTIQAVQAGVSEVTSASAKDTTLVVFRENRFCPFTSRLPEDYESKIRQVPGVSAVTPMSIVVNNCRTSLDVVTYRGVRPERFLQDHGKRLTVVDGSLQDWTRRTDAALVGRVLAERRGFKVGDRFDSSGITVSVAAIIDSEEPQDRNVAYVDLEFLQRAPGAQDGVVTQFNVKVDDPTEMENVAAAIDALFKNDREPTTTRSEKQFVARTAGDVMELVAFTRWLALGAVAAVLALVANAIILSVQDRVRDYGVLQTLGFTGRQVGGLVIAEGAILSVMGGVLGTFGAVAFLASTDWRLSNEGLSIGFSLGPSVWGTGMVLSLVLGVLAGLVPAFKASRIPIAQSFRAV